MTTTTDHTDTHTDTETAEAVELVRVDADPDRIQHLDPRGLLTDRNVRHDSAADAAAERRMVSSVRDVGVLQPIIAVVTDEGFVRVRFGHRRTRGAIAAGCATVPVIVRVDDGDATQAEADRIASQFVENDVRQGLSPTEQLSAFTDLAALGQTPGQIAKLTKARRRDVVDALNTATSGEARDAVAAANLTLEQGAVLAEFADDAEAYGALLDAVTGGGRSWESFEHIAERLRQDRAERAQRAEALADLAAAGVVVVTAPSHSGPVSDLDNLTNDPEPDSGADAESRPDGEPRSEPAPITPAEHADCPGHAAYLRRSYRGPSLVVAVYVCTDPLAHGHRARRSYVRLSPQSAPPQRVEETAEQAAAREAAKKDAETVQRRPETPQLDEAQSDPVTPEHAGRLDFSEGEIHQAAQAGEVSEDVSPSSSVEHPDGPDHEDTEARPASRSQDPRWARAVELREEFNRAMTLENTPAAFACDAYDYSDDVWCDDIYSTPGSVRVEQELGDLVRAHPDLFTGTQFEMWAAAESEADVDERGHETEDDDRVTFGHRGLMTDDRAAAVVREIERDPDTDPTLPERPDWREYVAAKDYQWEERQRGDLQPGEPELGEAEMGEPEVGEDEHG